MNVRTLASIVAAATLAGCAGSSTPAVTPPLLPLTTASQRIGSAGGSVATTTGARIDVPASFLQQGRTITLSHDPNPAPATGVAGWQVAPGTVVVALDSTAQRGSAAQGPTVTVPFPASEANAIGISRGAIIWATAPDGHTALVGADVVSIDTTRDVAVVALPPPVFDAALQARVGLLEDAPGGTAPQPTGGRYWNGTAWQGAPYPFDPSKRTVVLVHGIFSNVEQAFAAPCPSTIATAGAYQQTYGFDYDWAKPPDQLAQPLADFINSLPNTTVDIEAHSYGTIVTLAALPLLKKTVGHVVLLGGPLPLNGSPQTSHSWMIDTFLWGVKELYPTYASQINEAEQDGMIAALNSNSPAMSAIAQGLAAMPSLPPFVQVAGTKPLPVETSDSVIKSVYDYLYGSAVNDGVVEQASALTPQGTTVSTQSFPLYHTQLECDTSVINYVGPLVSH